MENNKTDLKEMNYDRVKGTAQYSAVSQYPINVLFSLSALRTSNLLTDVTIKVRSKSFRAHKVILASASPYFQSMFINKFKESVTGQVDLGDVASDTMEIILKFLYSGIISIDENIVNDVLKIGHMMELYHVVEACRSFLRRNLKPENAVSSMHLAKIYDFDELIPMTLNHIMENILDLPKEQFFKLTASELLTILKSNKLGVYEEEDIINILLHWLHHSKENIGFTIYNLLSTVRMSHVSQHSLNYLKNSKSLKEIPHFIHYLNNTINQEAILHGQTDNPRSYKAQEVYIVGGFKNEAKFRKLNLKTGHSTDLPDLPSGRTLHACSVYGGKLYIAGGKIDGDNLICFDPLENKWIPCSPMSTSRSGVAFIELDGMLYACGGKNNEEPRKSQSSVEKYDPSAAKWTRVEQMNEPRDFAGAAVYKNCIFVIGGNKDGTCLASCESYDLKKTSWSRIRDIPEPRSGSAVVAYQNSLYIIGGKNGKQEPVDTVYKYDLDKKIWELSTAMPTALNLPKACAINNNIYVAGGYSPSAKTAYDTILKFDLELCKWTETGKLPSPVYGNTVCLTSSQNLTAIL